MSDISSLNFDAKTVEPNAPFEVIPAGEYDAIIVNSKVETTKKGDGRLVNLELQILSGEYQNRKLFDRLNLWNPSEMAVKIARGTLSSICRSVNVLTPRDTAELHGKPLRVKVTVSDSPEYGKRNEVKGYMPRNGSPKASPTETVPQPGSTTAAESAVQAPW
jgi:hypothetical protein